MRLLPDNGNLRIEIDAECRCDSFLCSLYQCKEICCGCMAQIDEEIAMLSRYGRIANLHAFKAGKVDKFTSRFAAWRVLEKTAGT
jgi:hypothetical protein